MADASVHYGASTDGIYDCNHSAGRVGAIPKLDEIRNCPGRIAMYFDTASQNNQAIQSSECLQRNKVS